MSTISDFRFDFTDAEQWINQGSYWQRVIVYYDGAITPATPYNFVAGSWSNPTFQVRKYQDRTSELYVAGTESGLTVALGSAGTLTITMSSALTNAYTWTDGFYEVQARMPDGTNDFRLLYGRMLVNPEVIA